MKPIWVWMLAWIAVVCLLGSLTADQSMNPASSFEKHSVAWSKELRSPSSYPSLRVPSEGSIHSRAGPQTFSFTPDVLLHAEDLDPAGPPWLESRGPPGRSRGPGRPVGLSGAKVAPAALLEGDTRRSRPKFLAAGRLKFKKWGFATGFS